MICRTIAVLTFLVSGALAGPVLIQDPQTRTRTEAQTWPIWTGQELGPNQGLVRIDGTIRIAPATGDLECLESCPEPDSVVQEPSSLSGKWFLTLTALPLLYLVPRNRAAVIPQLSRSDTQPLPLPSPTPAAEAPEPMPFLLMLIGCAVGWLKYSRSDYCRRTQMR